MWACDSGQVQPIAHLVQQPACAAIGITNKDGAVSAVFSSLNGFGLNTRWNPVWEVVPDGGQCRDLKGVRQASSGQNRFGFRP